MVRLDAHLACASADRRGPEFSIACAGPSEILRNNSELASCSRLKKPRMPLLPSDDRLANQRRAETPKPFLPPGAASSLVRTVRAGAQGTRARTEILARLADSSPHGILLIDDQWRTLYANQQARRLAGLTAEDRHTRLFWEMYPSVLGTSLERSLREAAAARMRAGLDAFYHEPLKIWVDIDIVPMEHGLGVYFQDVTAKVKAEVERDREAQLLHQVLEATKDSIVSVDRHWRYTYINERAKVDLGESAALGKNLWECFPEAVYEGSPFVEHYYRAMDEGVAGEFHAEYPAPLNACFEVSVRPLKEGILICFRDVSRQKRAEASMLQVEKLAIVSRLASSIAHEINNPLAAVTNLLYLARERAEIVDVQRYLELAEQELRRVSAITSRSLRFHKQLTAPRTVSCLDLFTYVLTSFESRLNNAGVRVEKRKRAKQPLRCLDGEIAQVLNELISNALAAMPTGGRLQVRSRESLDRKTGRRGLVLTIADDGTGIAAEDRARIFDAFFSTKGIGGIGLGLWISTEIVRRHQGKLRIRSSRSERLHGTVAAVFLPFSTD